MPDRKVSPPPARCRLPYKRPFFRLTLHPHEIEQDIALISNLKKRRTTRGGTQHVPVVMPVDLSACAIVLLRLKNHRLGHLFNQSVARSQWPIEAKEVYNEIVDTPVDFGLVQARLSCGEYAHPVLFADDVRSVLKNAAMCAIDGSTFQESALELWRMFESDVMQYKIAAPGPVSVPRRTCGQEGEDSTHYSQQQQQQQQQQALLMVKGTQPQVCEAAIAGSSKRKAKDKKGEGHNMFKMVFLPTRDSAVMTTSRPRSRKVLKRRCFPANITRAFTGGNPPASMEGATCSPAVSNVEEAVPGKEELSGDGAAEMLRVLGGDKAASAISSPAFPSAKKRPTAGGALSMRPLKNLGLEITAAAVKAVSGVQEFMLELDKIWPARSPSPRGGDGARDEFPAESDDVSCDLGSGFPGKEDIQRSGADGQSVELVTGAGGQPARSGGRKEKGKGAGARNTGKRKVAAEASPCRCARTDEPFEGSGKPRVLTEPVLAAAVRGARSDEAAPSALAPAVKAEEFAHSAPASVAVAAAAEGLMDFLAAAANSPLHGIQAPQREGHSESPQSPKRGKSRPRSRAATKERDPSTDALHRLAGIFEEDSAGATSKPCALPPERSESFPQVPQDVAMSPTTIDDILAASEALGAAPTETMNADSQEALREEVKQEVEVDYGTTSRCVGYPYVWKPRSISATAPAPAVTAVLPPRPPPSAPPKAEESVELGRSPGRLAASPGRSPLGGGDDMCAREGRAETAGTPEPLQGMHPERKEENGLEREHGRPGSGSGSGSGGRCMSALRHRSLNGVREELADNNSSWKGQPEQAIAGLSVEPGDFQLAAAVRSLPLRKRSHVGKSPEAAGPRKGDSRSLPKKIIGEVARVVGKAASNVAGKPLENFSCASEAAPLRGPPSSRKGPPSVRLQTGRPPGHGKKGSRRHGRAVPRTPPVVEDDAVDDDDEIVVESKSARTEGAPAKYLAEDRIRIRALTVCPSGPKAQTIMGGLAVQEHSVVAPARMQAALGDKVHQGKPAQESSNLKDPEVLGRAGDLVTPTERKEIFRRNERAEVESLEDKMGRATKPAQGIAIATVVRAEIEDSVEGAVLAMDIPMKDPEVVDEVIKDSRIAAPMITDSAISELGLSPLEVLAQSAAPDDFHGADACMASAPSSLAGLEDGTTAVLLLHKVQDAEGPHRQRTLSSLQGDVAEVSSSALASRASPAGFVEGTEMPLREDKPFSRGMDFWKEGEARSREPKSCPLLETLVQAGEAVGLPVERQPLKPLSVRLPSPAVTSV